MDLTAKVGINGRRSRAHRITEIVRLLILPTCALAATFCGRNDEALRRQHLRNGDRYVTQHKPLEAIIEYRIAAQLDPSSADARKKLGGAYLLVNDSAHALGEFGRAADRL